MIDYTSLHASGELQNAADKSLKLLESCTLCPRSCGVNRLKNETGICQTGRYARIASYNLHYGEEAPLVGEHGSGTIFFAGCNLLCSFCQNYDISHRIEDSLEASPEQLAGVMLQLQKQGAHNINFVTPTHVAPQILEALPIAVENGLNKPLVYNSSGYDLVDTLKLLQGIVGIFMPDIKFWDAETAQQLCKARDYPQRAREAVREMYRQVGDLHLSEQGIATQGLLVRHLIMPGDKAGTREWMQFLAKEISPNTYLNIMDQYRPCGNAHKIEEINRGITPEEYQQALEEAKSNGMTRLDQKGDRLAIHLMEKLLNR